MTKTCPRCSQERDAAAFRSDLSKKDGLTSYCTPCKIDYDRDRREQLGQAWIDHSTAWVNNNREKHRNYCKTSWYKRHVLNKTRARAYHRKLRLDALEAYGGRCTCCGETIFEFLAIDHIDGGGSKQRAQLKGRSMYNWLKEKEYPPGFQVLCHNCNQAKGHFGECPHKLLKL